MNNEAKHPDRSIVVNLLLVSSLALIAFIPSLFVGFLSDDYLIIYQGIQKIENVQFFRPGSFWLNHACLGKSAFGYHLISVLLHVLSSVMVYLMADSLKSKFNHAGGSFSLIAAMLFAVYPFHTESVAWISGAASLGAGLFMFACLVFSFNYLSKEADYFSLIFGITAFFISLFFYESTWCFLLLPLAFLFLYKNKWRLLIIWYIGILASFSIFLFIKKHFIGTVWGVYGQEAHIRLDLMVLIKNYVRFFIRAILPPISNKIAYIGLFLLVITLVGKALMNMVKSNQGIKRWFFFLAATFIISLLPVINLSISSFTNESDRFLYFPSLWVCLFIASLFVFESKRKLLGVVVILSLTYNYYSQYKMVQVSNACRRFAEEVSKVAKANRRILVEDCPSTIQGVYAFRHGFPESLWFENENLDISNIEVRNVIDFESVPTLEIKQKSDTISVRFVSSK